MNIPSPGEAAQKAELLKKTKLNAKDTEIQAGLDLLQERMTQTVSETLPTNGTYTVIIQKKMVKKYFTQVMNLFEGEMRRQGWNVNCEEKLHMFTKYLHFSFCPADVGNDMFVEDDNGKTKSKSKTKKQAPKKRYSSSSEEEHLEIMQNLHMQQTPQTQGQAFMYPYGSGYNQPPVPMVYHNVQSGHPQVVMSQGQQPLQSTQGYVQQPSPTWTHSPSSPVGRSTNTSPPSSAKVSQRSTLYSGTSKSKDTSQSPPSSNTPAVEVVPPIFQEKRNMKHNRQVSKLDAVRLEPLPISVKF